MNLEKFFNPKSVAVIGASADPKKVGFALMSNLKNGRKIEVYPVNLENREIPENIDLAIIAVKAESVPPVLEDCGRKGIKNAIVISSGFKETGSTGEDLENKVSEIAKTYGMALLGPNCLGVIDSHNDFNASFSAQKPLVGKISFISQSGALGTALFDWARNQGVGISKFISLGNEAALTEVDFLEYLENDPQTSAVLMYLENVKNGPKFMETLKRITPKKPIVVIKAGMGSHGNLAIRSHTGALAPQASVFVSACQQAGAVTVSSLRAFFHIIKILPQTMEAIKPIQRLAVLTNGGGPSVVAADLIDHSHSLSLTVFSEETKEKLRKVLPPMAAVGNPIDIIGDALAERYDKTLEILSEIEDLDGIMAIMTPQMMTEPTETAKVLAKYNARKKIFPVFLGGSFVQAGREELIKSGMPYFTFPRDVVESLDYIARRAPKIKSQYGHHESVEPVSENNKMMPFEEARKLLSEYNLNIEGEFIKNKSDLPDAVSKLGDGLCAMKAISPEVIHKTEAGAVVSNIRDREEAERIFEEMQNKISGLEGVLVQKMERGKEVIIGMKRDITFGPVIIFGLGGIYTEAIKDTIMRVAPVAKEEILKIMREIKGIKILEGMRGEPPVNFDLLAEIIMNLSRLSLDHPEIKEIDLNPVVATDSSAMIVDARVMI